MARESWVRCPFCQQKTRLKIREDTEIRRLPLYCPKCRREVLIDLSQSQITIRQEPDA